jgi:hypothetical protein
MGQCFVRRDTDGTMRWWLLVADRARQGGQGLAGAGVK